MNSKANVVAMSIAAMVIVIAMAAFVVTFYQTQPPVTPINTAVSETQISVRKAIALGISKWAETGFDKKEATWYNNGNYPPSLQQAKNSLDYIVKEEIKKVLGELQTQRGYIYEFDNPAEGIVLKFDSDKATTTDQLNKDSVTVNVNGFSIKSQQGNAETVKEFSAEEKFDYSVWNLYTKMYGWALADSGEVSTNLELLLDSTPYQLQLCDCGAITKVNEDSVILNGSTLWEDRIDSKTGATIQGIESAVLKPALDSLKSQFASNPNVVCSYVVENKVVENNPTIIKRGQAGCECASGNALDNSTLILSQLAKAWRTDAIGTPAAYYGVAGRENATPSSGFETIESFVRIERTDPIPPLTYQDCNYFNKSAGDEALCNAGKMCFFTDKKCQDDYKAANQNYLDINGDNEAIGMTKRIAALVRFKCEDTSSKAKTELEFKNLTADVIVRFAVLKGSQPPEFCTTEVGPICLYGAVVTIIGIECTPWDDCFLDPQDAAACGVCECMIGKQIITPTAKNGGLQWWTQHESGTTFNCLDPKDPACIWCHDTMKGEYKCPSSLEVSETTPECNSLLAETISGGKSEQCLQYECVVDAATNTVKKGCAWLDNSIAPIPCDTCKRCGPEGTCVLNDAKVGQPCAPPATAAKGAVQDCFMCNDQGNCVVKAEAVGIAQCSNSNGCLTYCNDNGTCSFVNNADIGKNCPTNKPDYNCAICKVLNNKLSCTSTCAKGCCSDGTWGRCIGDNSQCCPETHTLTKCPSAT